MEFDPAELVKKKEGTFCAPTVIADYLEKRMKRCLTKDEHEALIKDHPKPDLPACKVPAVDKFMKEFLGKRFRGWRASKDPSSGLTTNLPNSLCVEFVIRQ